MLNGRHIFNARLTICDDPPLSSPVDLSPRIVSNFYFWLEKEKFKVNKENKEKNGDKKIQMPESVARLAPH